MAQPLVRALTERGERVRIYMPFGELIPGMAYLVRRLLENTSNESFLRRGFAEHESPDALLADPEQIRVAPPPRAPQDFESEPHADFTRAAVRDDFAAALAAVRSRLGGDHPLVIDGRRVPTAEFTVSVTPSRAGEVVGRVAAAGAAEIDRAVAAAARAFAAWRDAGVEARAAALGRVAAGLRERRYVLAAWTVFEAGKPWAEADADVAEAIDFVEYYRAQARELQRPLTLGRRRGEVNHYTREARGVVGVIAPWNFPLAILTGMTSAALATGNTVVMKPAEQTPVIAAQLMEVFEAAGLPPGVVNYAPGRGEAAGTLPTGPAEAPGTIVGPVIDEASRERIVSYIDLGKRLARPVLLREPDRALDALGGYYVAPAIFADVPLTCALAREEIFGPVLSCVPAATFEEALAIATSLDYALTGGVFSRSPVRLARARQAFRVGNLYINRATTGARVGRQPFGGRQLSGIGWQAGGPDYLVQFIETRVVTENTLRRGFASNELA